MGFEAEITVYLDNGNNFSFDLTPGMWEILRAYAGLRIDLKTDKYTVSSFTDEQITKILKKHPGYSRPEELDIKQEINRHKQAIKNLEKLKSNQ